MEDNEDINIENINNSLPTIEINKEDKINTEQTAEV